MESNITLTGVTVTGAVFESGIRVVLGTLTLNNCTLSNNRNDTVTGVGNLLNDQGSVTIINSVISGGYADLGGGGIVNDEGTMTLIGSTVSGNFGGYRAFGGGIGNYGTTTIIDSTISGNTTSLSGSAGAGIVNSGNLTVSNSTITGNSADSGTGGGISLLYGSLTLKGTLLANHGAGGNCSSLNNIGGTTNSLGYDLSDDTTCNSWLTSSTDTNNKPAQLAGGLQNNGGPTQTVALSPGSPAVDAIPVANCTDANGNAVTTDQRGITRPQGKGCDIGAYELVQAVPFSSFHPSLVIDNGKHPGFVMTSTFTLGSGTTRVNPATEAMTLQIANYTLTLPAGSFHPLWTGTKAPYAYEGTVNGTKVLLGLASLGNNTFAFDAAGAPVTFSGVKNPVTITLTFGNDSGTTPVTAVISTY